jgi:transcriptional regulator with XRE-family HTH domain
MPKKKTPKIRRAPTEETPRAGRPMADGPMKPMAEAAGGFEPLAELLGVHVRTLSKWNRREVVPEGPTRRLLRLIAEELEVDPPFAD